MTTKTKPQAAIEAGLKNYEEAAQYLGMGPQAFKLISRQIPSINLGRSKYYAVHDLLGYLAKLQQAKRNLMQSVEN
ncbi:MAG: hypothetical protein IPM42_22140 [Saprospiraceae bacterium]|nr:hypothetical protein [Saprospiraceae bacterium]MBK9258149.1 hypothetical protein [Saprospiraceae bacterium]